MKRAACLLAAVAFVAGCGSNGVREVSLSACTVHVAGGQYGAALVAEIRDGSVVVGASRRHGSHLRVVLKRVGPACRPVRSFGVAGTATLGVRTRRAGAIDALQALPDGKLLLAGSDGRHELVGRLLGDGRLDRAFGRGGWTRITVREKTAHFLPPPAPLATSIAVAPSGSIVLGGDDQAAHCCVQDFVSELSADGTPVRRFGRDGSILLRPLAASYTTNVFVDAQNRIYVQGETIFSGCGGPEVVRIRPDGTLDGRFDSAAVRSVKTVETRRRLLFEPTLVPRGRRGAFVLIGGLSKECGPVRHPRWGGVATGLLPSGKLDRTYARFPSPAGVFETTVATRLASGRLLAAGQIYSGTGRLGGVIVRAFRSDGSIDRGFGSAGVRTIPRGELPRGASVTGLLPAPNGEAWLVVASPREVRLLPVPAGA